jgi:hypothetical protein
VLLGYAAVGAVAGVVWEAIWTPPIQIVQHHQIYYVDYASLRRVFTGTGLYVLVASVASAVATLVVVGLARGRELLALAEVVIGSAIAALVMARVGISLGPDDPQGTVASTPNGTKVDGTLAINGHSPYLVWPMVALLVLALVFFAWNHPRRPGAADPWPDDPAEAGVPGAPAR